MAYNKSVISCESFVMLIRRSQLPFLRKLSNINARGLNCRNLYVRYIFILNNVRNSLWVNKPARWIQFAQFAGFLNSFIAAAMKRLKAIYFPATVWNIFFQMKLREIEKKINKNRCDFTCHNRKNRYFVSYDRWLILFIQTSTQLYKFYGQDGQKTRH